MTIPFVRCVVLAVCSTFVSALAQGAPLVAIDVGHTLARPGVTAASGRPEFELNRSLAQVVVERLRTRGVPTILIGADGEANSLTQRTATARGAALFVSLHHDSVQPHYLNQVDRFSGFAILVSRKNADPRTSLSCAQRVGDALIASGRWPSRYHAEPIAGENRPFADEARGVHWFDDLVVLKTATQPALLIESAVVVNPADEQAAATPEGRARLADAIAAGVASCVALASK